VIVIVIGEHAREDQSQLASPAGVLDHMTGNGGAGGGPGDDAVVVGEKLSEIPVHHRDVASLGAAPRGANQDLWRAEGVVDSAMCGRQLS
jgi:hypothetical protein